MIFQSREEILEGSWQSFERNVCRLLIHDGFKNVRLVGGTGDHGADIIATRETSRGGMRWLFQVKRWNRPVGRSVVDDTLQAAEDYGADVPVIVSASGFDADVCQYQKTLQHQHTPLQLWSLDELRRRSTEAKDEITNTNKPRPYQENAIQTITSQYFYHSCNKALIIMATGLGKTFVAAESIRRIRKEDRCRVLVCAHVNDLVYQLEKAFWPFLKPSERTIVWNSNEKNMTYQKLESADFTFACIDSVSNWIKNGDELPNYDILLVDECHHVGGQKYETLFDHLGAGKPGGPFTMGLTATPWRSDDVDIREYFGPPLVSIDIVKGLRNGFLTNIDYRMYTDNIDWDSLKNIEGKRFSPKQINKTLFIEEWDESVVYTLRDAWKEQTSPRAIVFCGNIEHAKVMKNKINSLGFASAEAIYSSGSSDYDKMTSFERNRILCDFSDGKIDIVCAVNILNEGIDVPDVNIIVFQRVTHSRLIFVQQLGRGLRIAEGKEKVIVLDFVSDIRRFAAGLDLKDQLEKHDGNVRISIPNKVTFKRSGEEDPRGETFLRQWLDDVAAVEDADDESNILKFPPVLTERQ